MLTLFREKLEQGVADMYGMTDAQNQEMKVQDVDMKEATNFLGYI